MWTSTGGSREERGGDRFSDVTQLTSCLFQKRLKDRQTRAPFGGALVSPTGHRFLTQGHGRGGPKGAEHKLSKGAGLALQRAHKRCSVTVRARPTYSEKDSHIAQL